MLALAGRLDGAGAGPLPKLLWGRERRRGDDRRQFVATGGAEARPGRVAMPTSRAIDRAEGGFLHRRSIVAAVRFRLRDGTHLIFISRRYTGSAEIRARRRAWPIDPHRRLARTTILIALALVAALAAGCGSSGSSSTTTTSSSASTLAPIHGKYSPSIDPGELRRHGRQPLLAAEARHRLPLQGRARDDPAARRRDRHPSDQADPGHREHGRPGHGLRARRPGRADLRLLRPGQAGQRLVHGRAVAREAARRSSSRPATRGCRASTAAEPGIIMPADPQPGDEYRQEYYPPGEALDEAHVLSRTGRRRCRTAPTARPGDQRVQPARAADRAEVLRPGLGEVKERVVKGHHEEFQLVA